MSIVHASSKQRGKPHRTYIPQNPGAWVYAISVVIIYAENDETQNYKSGCKKFNTFVDLYFLYSHIARHGIGSRSAMHAPINIQRALFVGPMRLQRGVASDRHSRNA